MKVDKKGDKVIKIVKILRRKVYPIRKPNI